MALFADPAGLAETLAQEDGRLKKRAAIADALTHIYTAAPGTADAGRFALYLTGQPFAENNPRKLNVGGALLSRAVLTVSGANDTALTALLVAPVCPVQLTSRSPPVASTL